MRAIQDRMKKQDEEDHHKEVREQNTIDAMDYSDEEHDVEDIVEWADEAGQIVRQSTAIQGETNEAKERRRKKTDEAVLASAANDEKAKAQRKRREQEFTVRLGKWVSGFQVEAFDCSTHQWIV